MRLYQRCVTMSRIDNMLVADWARYFYDIQRVRQRILYGKFGVKWANLTELKKQQLCDEVASEIKNIIDGKPVVLEHSKDRYFYKHGPEAKDLMRYGINYEPT